MRVAHLLDTNILIELRDGDPAIVSRVSQLSGAVMMSIISRVELEGGVFRDPANSGPRRARLDVILQTLPVLDFDEASADAYRRIVEVAGYSRRKLLDRMIAAQALVHRASLVTRNAVDFQDVPGLELLGW